MRINFDFGDLEAFLAVMETASFHLAAEQLHLSQSAVTRRIQKLEQVLGSKLFERTTRAVKPTLAAKRLQSRAEEMLDNAEETTLAMRDESVAFAHQKGAVVTIAMIPTLIAPLFLPGLSSMRQADETARIRLMDLSANEVAEAVSSGEADFGICSIGSLEANTHFEPWFDDEIVLAIPIEHQLAAQDNVRWPDLLNEDLILPARGTGNRLLIDDAMAKGRISAQWTYEVGRSTTAMEMVSGGVGIALLPRSAATSAFAQGLRFKKLPKPVVTRPIGLLTRMGVSDTPVVSSVKDSLREYAANI
ncbi:LysR family transcriptional regulator [Roseibium alexandrii]|uniref:LysR family transcriptional regulator n=1 Tax=Roseibium alexandrii TaxID=388408 RepID=UPI003750A8C6